MAHFVAKTGSRFQYSHDTWHLPVDGLVHWLKDEQMQMTIRKVNGKQVPYHSCMHFVHRSKGLHHLCSYQFFSQMQVISLKKAENENIEHFEFSDKHPMHQTTTAIYRESACVPVFAWNWLPSTIDWETPIFDHCSKTDPYYNDKEQYAFRFMVLFLPFQTLSDLQIDGSHILAFQEAYKNDLFHPDMLQVANNIQDVLNSIEAGFPDNPLNLMTDADFEENQAYSTDPNEDADDTNNLNLAIGEYLSSTGGSNNLKEDATEFNPNFLSHQNFSKLPSIPEEDVYSKEDDDEDVPIVFDSETTNDKRKSHPLPVIEFLQDPSKKPDVGLLSYNETRFSTEVSELDTVALQTVENTETVIDEKTGETKEKKFINANGTWQSIVKWGINAGLDLEQHTAFEILAATFVLTFYDEAKHDKSDETFFEENKKALEELARKNMTKDKPLRMFITGPAGAGKCKFALLLSEICFCLERDILPFYSYFIR